jgi:hypothetical protein
MIYTPKGIRFLVFLFFSSFVFFVINFHLCSTYFSRLFSHYLQKNSLDFWLDIDLNLHLSFMNSSFKLRTDANWNLLWRNKKRNWNSLFTLGIELNKNNWKKYYKEVKILFKGNFFPLHWSFANSWRLNKVSKRIRTRTSEFSWMKKLNTTTSE